MLKSFAIVSLAAAAAFAQSTGSKSLIPDGISPVCNTFLVALNADTQLSTCIAALTSALSAFAPGGNATVSASTVTGALTSISSSSISSSCPENLIGSKIAQFYTACSPELTSTPVADVVRLYDVLYSITPMQKAISSKDDSGKWCAMAATPAAGSSADALQAALYTQDGQNVIPNTSTFSSNNLPFLFINPSLDATALCTACTRNVLTAYINYESNVPYAPGLAKSQLLKTQSDLFAAVQEKCGSTFMDNEVKAAGGLSSGPKFLSAAAPSAELQSLMALLAGFATLAVTATF